MKYTASVHRDPPAPIVPPIQTNSLVQTPIYDLALPRLSGLDERLSDNSRNRAILARRISEIQQRSFSE